MNGSATAHMRLLRSTDPAIDADIDSSCPSWDQLLSLTQGVALTGERGRVSRRLPPALRSRRNAIAGAAVLVAATGLATAAAAGWITPQVRDAFDSPAMRRTMIAQFGAAADLSKAQQWVTTAGPDGSTVSTWTVPVASRGICATILVSQPSAPLSASARGTSEPGVTCFLNDLDAGTTRVDDIGGVALSGDGHRLRHL